MSPSKASMTMFNGWRTSFLCASSVHAKIAWLTARSAVGWRTKVLYVEQPLLLSPKRSSMAGYPNTTPSNHGCVPIVSLDEHADDDPHGLGHGLAVTSAFLFGPIQPNGSAHRPYAYVDHLRVLDKARWNRGSARAVPDIGACRNSLRCRANISSSISAWAQICRSKISTFMPGHR